MPNKNPKIRVATAPAAEVEVMPDVQPLPEAGSAAIKEETIAWCLALLGTVVIWLALAKLTILLYRPDVAALKAAAQALFIDEGAVRPEPVEAMIFRLSVIVLVPAVVLLHRLVVRRGLAARLAGGIPFHIISWGTLASVAVLLYCGLVAVNPFGPKGGDSAQNRRDLVSDTNFDFYFKWMFVGGHTWLYLLVVVPVVCALFLLGYKKYGLDEKRPFRLFVNVAGFAVSAFMIIAIVAMNTVEFPYTDENKYDFAAVYYAMTQVFAGSPMLVNGFTDTYGLYPHFLLPIFRITGLSVMKFSLVMSLLLGGCFALNFWLMRKLVKDHVLLFMGFVTIVFFPYLNFKLLTIFDCIFSLFPIRYIIPSVVTVLAMLYFGKRRRWLYYITFLCAALFILWNPEIGMTCYLAWLCATIYADWYDAAGRVNTKAISLHLVVAAGMVVAVLLAYKLLIFAGYGAWPDVGLLFSAIAYFGKSGFSLLPMRLIHPWNLSALVLLMGFLYSGRAWWQRAVTPRTTMVFLISMVGVGYFTYFQGRSQNSNYAISSGFSFIVLTILADELWGAVKKTQLPPLSGLFVLVLIILSFSGAEVVYNAKKIWALTSQEEAKLAQAASQERIENNSVFIENVTRTNEKIVLLTVKKHQPLFFNGTRIASGFNPGYIDMFLKKDLERLEQTVTDSSFKIYLEPHARIYPYFDRVMAAAAATYEHATHNKHMLVLEKRTTRIPQEEFFTGSDMALHRKYTDDAASIKQRIADAAGTEIVNLNGPFSVSALFYNVPQYLDHPVVIGNLKDSCGFVIACTNIPFNYTFGVNTSGMTVAVPGKRWVYAVMNVTNTTIEVYINGHRIFNKLITRPMRNSDLKVRVGNLGDFHNVIGPIAEVAVSRHILDSTEINGTWERMAPVVMPAAH